MRMALLGSVAASALAVSGAFAADLGMPMKSPVAPPPPAPSWTGCYVGTQGGLGNGHTKWTDSVPDGNIDAFSTSNRTANTDLSGSVYGGQIGCDLQFNGTWVVGLQGLFAGSDITGTNMDQFNNTWSLRDKIDWYASATARLGWTANNVLVYVRGGAAWAHNKLEVENTNVTIGTPEYTQLGWTVGSGLEWAFTPGFAVFVEGNYYNFANKTSSLTATPGLDNAPFTFNTKQDFETLTIGLNYRWGGWAAPVTARY